MTNTLEQAVFATITPLTPSLSLTQQALAKNIALQARAVDIEIRAQKIREYRQYYDGDHPANLTEEMRNLLRTARHGAEFTTNFCKRIVHARSDRLIVSRIETDTEAGNQWAQQFMEDMHFAAVQSKVHKCAIRDGETFVMVSFDNATRRAKITAELSYDGTNGVIALYKSQDLPVMDAAVKVWHEINQETQPVDVTRINVYFPNRIEKYRTNPENGLLEPYREPGDPGWPIWWTEDLTPTGAPLGIPFVHFMNLEEKNQGLSVLEDAIPLQDAANRVLHSLVYAGELTAFQIYVAFGFETDGEVTPGMWLEVPATSKDENVDAKVLSAGDLTQLITLWDKLDQKIHDVTNTPRPDSVSTDASGEARKEVETYLLGELRNFQNAAGAKWEQAVALAHKLEQVFGVQEVPEIKRFYCKWQDLQVRNDDKVVANAMLVNPIVGTRETLRIIAPVFDYDEQKIEQIMAEKQAEQEQQLARIVATMPETSGKFSKNPQGPNQEEQ